MDYQPFLKQTLQKASGIALDNFGKVSGVAKSHDNNQVLTVTDVAVGKLIVSEIQEAYPNHNVVDEEAGVIDNNSPFTWVVDSIDGTSNYAAGLPFYGVMIGLLKGSVPIVGGVELPFFTETFIAEKDKGSFCNGKKLTVTKETNLLSTLVMYPIDGYQNQPEITYEECRLLADIVLGIRNLRTTGSIYDALLVAKGNVGGFLNRTSKIWDNVAAQLLIEEAGGMYTDFFGKPMDYSDPLMKAKDNFTACAAAPALHKQLQKIIHKDI